MEIMVEEKQEFKQLLTLYIKLQKKILKLSC